jgi:hypothetical protein
MQHQSKEGNMRLQLTSGTTRIFASGLLLLGCSSLAFAGACRRCNPCPNGANGDFFGYYPTNWRPWPGVTVTPMQEQIPAPAPRATPLPPSPSSEQAVPPKPADKPPEQTLSPSTDDFGTKVDQQPYSAPPQ